jgi:hypothetical protein
VLSVAPELRRGRVGSEAAEHARRSYLAALRTADGQSITKDTPIATEFLLLDSGVCRRRRLACGMMGTLQPMALVATAGKSPVIARPRPRNRRPTRAAPRASSPKSNTTGRRAIGHRRRRDRRGIAGHGGKRPVKRPGGSTGGTAGDGIMPRGPDVLAGSRFYGLMPAGQAMAPNGSPVVGAGHPRKCRPVKAAKRAKRRALKRRRKRHFAQGRFLTQAGLTQGAAGQRRMGAR